MTTREPQAPESARSPERIERAVTRCLGGHAADVTDRLRGARLWDAVASRACEIGVGAMLSDALAKQGVRVPRSTGAILEAYREHVAALNAYQVPRAARALAALDHVGIPFLVLKGAALNATFYPTPDVRGMTDIDLLIRPADVERADRALSGAGCTRGRDPVREHFFPRFYYEREYHTPDHPPVRLDLHVRPFRPLYFAHTVPELALWDDPDTAAFHGRPVRVPNPSNMAIHLCVHAACHGARHPRWLFEILRYLDARGDAIDPEWVARTADEWRVGYALRVALQGTLELFPRGTPLIHRLLDLLPRQAGFRERLAVRQSPHDAERPWGHVLTDLFCLPGPRARAAYVWAMAVPDAAHMRAWYGHDHAGWLPVAHAARLMHGLLRPLLPPARHAET